MILLLDTTNPQRIRFGLSEEGRGLFARREYRGAASGARRADATTLLLSFLNERRAAGTLDGVILRDGAGTFSGVRLGVVIANSIALARRIPVAAVQFPGVKEPSLTAMLKKGRSALKRKNPGTYLVPHYSHPPNISSARKRRRKSRMCAVSR